MSRCEPGKEVTLKDIAAHLQVSVPTVSMGLNGTGTLSHRTRERVRRAAEALGYQPDPLLSALSARRSSGKRSMNQAPLRVLVGKHSHHRPESYLALLRKEAERAGFCLELESVRAVEDYPALLHRFYHCGVQGVLMLGAPWSDACPALPWHHFSLVTLRQDTCPIPLHCVRSSIFGKWKEMADRVEATGKACVGQVIQVLTENLEHHEDVRRAGSALAVQAIRRHTWPEPMIQRFATPATEAKRAIREYVKTEGCDALLVTTAGIYHLLEADNRRGRSKIGIASGLVSPAEAKRGLSGMLDNRELLCREVVRRLEQAIRHGERGLPQQPANTVVEAQWNPGHTV